jgi:hypothetical protein
VSTITYATLITSQRPSGVALAQVQVFEPLSAWTATGGQTIVYQTPIEQRMDIHSFKEVTSCSYIDPEEDPEDPAIPLPTDHKLVSRASIGLVQANPGSFYFDLSSSTLYISLFDSTSPSGKYVKAGFYLYFSTGMAKIGAVFIDPDGNRYDPVISAIPDVSKKAQDPFAGSIVTGTGNMSLVNNDRRFNEVFSQYIWENGTVILLFGGDDLPFSEYKEVFRGFSQDRKWEENSFTIKLKDPHELLLNKIPLEKYTLNDAVVSTVYRFYGPFSIDMYVPATVNCRPADSPNSPFPLTVDFPNTYYLDKAPIQIETWADVPVITGTELPLTTSRIPVDNVKPILYGTHYGIKGTLLAASPAEAILQLSGHALKSIDKIVCNGIVLKDNNGAATGLPDNQYPNGAPAPEDSAISAYVSQDNRFVYLQRTLGDFDLGSAAGSASFDIQGAFDPDTGELIDNFADIYKNLVINKAKLPVEIDEDILAQSRFLNNMYVARIRIDSETELRNVLQNINKSTLAYSYLTKEGKLAYRVWTPDISNEVVLSDGAGDIMEISLETDSTRAVPVITVEYGEDQSSTKNFRKTTDALPEGLGGIYRANPYTVSQSYQADDKGAFILNRRLTRFAMRSDINLTLKTKLKLMDANLLDRVLVDRPNLPIKAGLKLHAEILGQKRNLKDDTVELELDDQRLLGLQAFLALDCLLSWLTATEEERRTSGFWTKNGYVITGVPESFGRSRYY